MSDDERKLAELDAEIERRLQEQYRLGQDMAMILRERRALADRIDADAESRARPNRR